MAVTDAQLQAALVSAAAQLSWGEMAALMKKAVIEAHFDGTGSVVLPWQSVNSDGTSITRIPYDRAVSFLDFCVKRASGGVVSQLAEFRTPR